MAQYPTVKGDNLRDCQVIISFCLKAATHFDITAKEYQCLWKHLKSQIIPTPVADIIDTL